MDPLPIQTVEKIALEALSRETVRELVDMILEWRPPGAEEDEEGDDADK